MFAKKENGALRSRLASLESDHKLGRVSTEAFQQLAFEILTALEKLGETLTIKERELIERVSTVCVFTNPKMLVLSEVALLIPYIDFILQRTKDLSQYEATSGSSEPAIGKYCIPFLFPIDNLI